MTAQRLRRLLTILMTCTAASVPSTARAQFPLEVLHRFDGELDARGPEARLIEGRDGHLYGTMSEGGANHRGTIFRLTRAGAIASSTPLERVAVQKS